MLTVLAILGGVGALVAIGEFLHRAVKWMKAGDNLERLRDAVRQRFCRHDWKPIQTSGDGWIYVTPYREACRKCGARR